MTTLALTSLQDAEHVARLAVAELSPACERIEIAGAVRRRCRLIETIDLVAIAREESVGLFGLGKRSMLWARLDALCADGRLAETQGGEFMRRYEIVRSPGLQLCIATATPETWAHHLLTRTGPAAFVRECNTEASRGGRLDDDLIIRDSRVWRYAGDRVPADAAGHAIRTSQGFHVAVPTPEERDLLKLAGGWVEPAARRGGLPRRTRARSVVTPSIQTLEQHAPLRSLDHGQPNA